jgi:cytochrome c1
VKTSGSTKKRTQFGKRRTPPRPPTLEQQQRRVAAYLNMLRIANEKKE